MIAVFIKKCLHNLSKYLNFVFRFFGFRLIRIQSMYEDLNIYEERARPKPARYLNIGAGNFRHPFWHNMDMPNKFYKNEQKKGIDIVYNLTSQIPFPLETDSLKLVYCSHVAEHLTDDDVAFFFREVFRCLRPRGYFRITCPDIDLEYEAYMRGDTLFWTWPTPWGTASRSIEQKFLEHFATALTIGNSEQSYHKFSDKDVKNVFDSLPKEKALSFFIKQIPNHLKYVYPEYHINWFNSKKLIRMLEEAGFKKVYESRFGQSQSALLRNIQLFDLTCPELTLYVECQK